MIEFLRKYIGFLVGVSLLGLVAVFQVYNTNASEDGFKAQGASFSGTGFFVQDQVILTAYHVVEGSRLAWLIKPDVIQAFLNQHGIVSDRQSSTINVVYVENQI